MITIKKMKKTAAPSLKMNMHKRIPRYDNARSHKVLHASDMTRDIEFCPREFALQDVTKFKKKGQFLGTSQVITFDMGDAIHDMVRENWALPESIGTWACVVCKTRHPFQKKPISCGWEGCKSKVFRYEEEVFISQSHGATGSIDMIADLGQSKYVIVEIKSIDKDQFKDLLGPKAEHKWRTNLYLRMIANSNHHHKHKIDLSRGLILYVVKGYGIKDVTLKEHGIKDMAFSPFKEFWVSRDDNDTDAIWERATSLYDFRVNNGPMPAGICATAFCKRAQSCELNKQCWSGNFPSGL